MNEFHFLRPEALWGFTVFLLLPFLASRSRTAGGLWRLVCDRALLKCQLVSGTARRSLFPVVLAALCWTIGILALAGPVWERLPQPVLKKGNDTVFALDISLFMSVSDLKPSRMDRARFKLHDFLQDMKGGQYALELYDNEPFVAVPLTPDVRMIENVLPTVEAGMMGGRMPRPDLALEKARQLLEQAKSSRGQVILLGAYVDSAYVNDAVKAAAALKKSGHTVSVLGVGTLQGAPIQLPDGSFYQSRSGKPLLSGLSQAAFEKIAAAGGGVYRQITLGDSDVKAILAAAPSEAPDFERQDENRQKTDAWKDAGVYLTLLLLPFAALGFRRGWLGAVLLYLALAPAAAQAWTWQDLWERPDRQEAARLHAGEKPLRPEAFGDDPAWRGAAEYKTGDYARAAETLGRSADVETAYNRGNALAHAGKLKEAIDAYKNVLERNPEHADAAFNKKYLEEQLKKQQQQQNQNQQPQNPSQNPQNQPQNQQNPPPDQEDKSNPEQPQNAGSNQESKDSPKDGQKQGASEEQSPDDSGKPEERGEKMSDAERRQQEEERQARARKAEEEKREDGPKGEPRRQEGQKDDNAGQSPEKGAPGTKTDEKDREKQEQLEWLSTIEDDPSGLLRERIRRRNMQKRRIW